jgi:hypothetical protein
LSRFDRGTDAKVDRARTRASSLSLRTTQVRRLVAGNPRRSILFLALVMLLGIAGVALAGPTGTFGPGTGADSPGLVKAGPVNPSHGFPDWYRDRNGEELEPCLDPGAVCAAPPVPNPDAPVSFPANFPDEFFYMLATADMTANGGNLAQAEFAVEGAFATAVQPADQMVFTRIRYRVRGGLRADTDYKFIHPYGTDIVHTDPGAGDLFITEDIGVTPGNFNEAMTGRVGPFLKWDPAVGDAPPAGYVGDGATPHRVVGSELGTNFVRLEGPGVGGGEGDVNPNPCTTTGDHAYTGPVNDCIETDLFTLAGKISTKGGVDIARATYSRDADGRSKHLDVFADSKVGEDIIVQDGDSGPARRFATTPLRGEKGNYFAHVDIAGDVPQTIDVVNRGDIPKTVKHVKVTDLVTGSAIYHNGDPGPDAANPSAGMLHVEATSSDKATTGGPRLKVLGREIGTDGQIDIPVSAPTPNVKITSDKGGSIDVPVQADGPGFPPLPLTADAGPDQTVEQGVTVQLDANGSAGNIDSYQWTAPDGVTLSDSTSPTPTFTAPNAEGNLTFTLKVSGVDGSPPAPAMDEDTVTIHVDAVAPAHAVIAGASPRTVPQNSSVTLSSEGSTGAAKFEWSQDVSDGDPVVPMGTTNGPTVTFTFPKTDRTLTFRLTVRNPADADPTACAAPTCDTTTVQVAPGTDTLTIAKARFIPDQARWFIDGTATDPTNNEVTVHSGPTLDGPVIGKSPVDTLGAWSVDVRDSTVPLDPCKCVSVESARGGEILAFELEKAAQLPAPPPAVVAAAAGPNAAAAAVPLLGATRLAAAKVAIARTISAAAVGAAGVPVTVAVPEGASIVRLRVMTTKAKVLYAAFHKVKGGTKVRVKIKSAKLRRKLRAGKRYVVEVRAGTAENRLGKATRRVIRVRR